MASRSILCVLVFLFPGISLYGTHLKGGYIHASHLHGNTYFLKVVYYADPESNIVFEEKQPLQILGVEELLLPKLGEQTNSEQRLKIVSYGMNYAFGAPDLYQLRVVSPNRTKTLNCEVANPVVFFTTLDTGVSGNNVTEPQLPALQTGIFEIYELPLPERDSDGDSLSYQLSKVYTDLGVVPVVEEAYRFPNEIERKGIFKIRDSKLVWNAPTLLGQYTCAYIRNEWRHGRIIGKTLVEFTIDVKDNGGVPVEIPPFEEVLTSIDGLVTAINGDFKGPTALTIYPVPARQYIYMAAESAGLLRHTFDLIDSGGRVLQQSDAGEPARRRVHRFHVQGLAPGFYFIRVRTEEGTTGRRFVKP